MHWVGRSPYSDWSELECLLPYPYASYGKCSPLTPRSLLLVLVEIHPMPVQLSNQTKIQDSHADFYCSLCIFPSAETWLKDCYALLGNLSLGHNLESASRKKPRAIGELTSFAFLLWINTILSCCQMSYILSSYSVSYCGKASLEFITVIDRSRSLFGHSEYHFLTIVQLIWVF